MTRFELINKACRLLHIVYPRMSKAERQEWTRILDVPMPKLKAILAELKQLDRDRQIYFRGKP